MHVSLDRKTLVAAVAVSAVAGVLLEAASLPDGSEYRAAWPDTTAYMALRVEQAREAGDRMDLRYRPVPLSRIPEDLRRAVRVAEDAAFYQHSGLDFHELRAALAEAWREKRPPRGASTITQQLARNLYLPP
jgi:membrane peptidoglycan carboxypeptidase